MFTSVRWADTPGYYMITCHFGYKRDCVGAYGIVTYGYLRTTTDDLT